MMRRVFSILLSMASFVFMTMLVLFCVTAAAVWWVTSTATGQRLLSEQINAATADTGYSIRIDGIHAIGAGQIQIDRLRVADHGQSYVGLERLRIRPSLAALLDGRLRLGLTARQVAIFDATVPATPYTAPPIPSAAELKGYLASLPLAQVTARVQIEQLVFVDLKGVASNPLSPDVSASLRKTDAGAHAEIIAQLKGATKEPLHAELYSDIDLGDAPAIVIDALQVKTAGVDQTVTGRMALPATPEDTAALPLALQSAWSGEPLRLQANLLQSTQSIDLQDIALEGPGTSGQGQFHYGLNDGAMKGDIKAEADVDALAKAAPDLGPLPVHGKVGFTLSFDGPQLSLQVPQLALDGARLQDLNLTTTPLPDNARHVELSVRETVSATALKAKATLRLPEGGFRVEDLDATLSPGKAGDVALSGVFDMAGLDLTAAAKSLRLDRLQGVLAAGAAPVRLDGTTIRLTGTGAAPVVALDGKVTPLSLPKGAPSLLVAVQGKIAAGMLDATATVKSRALKTGTATLRQPMTLTLQPFAFDMPQQGLDAHLALAGDLKAFGPLLPQGLSVTGPVDLDAAVTGSFAAPKAAGSLNWRQGRLHDNTSGVDLRNIALAAAFSQDRIDIKSLTAQDAKTGTLQAGGQLTLDPATWPVSAQVKMRNIAPFGRGAAASAGGKPLVDGLFSADLSLKGARKSYLLQGQIGTDKLNITLPERFGSSVPQLNIVEKRHAEKSTLPGAEALALDVAFAAPARIFVRGWGLDAEFGGKLAIKGTAADPLVNGSLDLVRGRYEEFGRRFTLSRASLNFVGKVPPSPYLDVLATTSIDGLDANVAIGGNAQKPEITFSSVPALPQEDVLARILFGRERSDITPTQALQLAQTLARFSGKGGAGLDPLGAIRSTIGLDDLSVDSSAEGGASVGAGKYLADDVYLEVDSGAGGKGGEAKVKVDLTPNIKAESKIGQDATAGGGIFWEWEY